MLIIFTVFSFYACRLAGYFNEQNLQTFSSETQLGLVSQRGHDPEMQPLTGGDSFVNSVSNDTIGRIDRLSSPALRSDVVAPQSLTEVLVQEVNMLSARKNSGILK